MTMFATLMSVALFAVAGASDPSPLACQTNADQPMLPIFHIIGNVSTDSSGVVTKLEPINDCSGVTYYGGLYHVWHQCCQNHWDHVISKDLIHWQRLPPPIQPVTTKTWDGSISMLDAADGGPLILYDAQDGKTDNHQLSDSPILGVARLVDPNDKYLNKWVRAANNPTKQLGGSPIAFPGQVWKNGDYWNFIGQGARFQSNDSTFHTWTRMNDMVGRGEHGGQWWVPVPNQVDGTPPPADVPNYLVNVGGGDALAFGEYYANNETFVPWQRPQHAVQQQQQVQDPVAPVTRLMQNTDLKGADIRGQTKHHAPGDPQFGPIACQAACDALADCKSWTWVIRGNPKGSGDCCLKNGIPCPVAEPGMTSGAKVAGNVSCGNHPPHPGPHPGPAGVQAQLERGNGGWWGTQQANDRMMMIGWALPDYHGAAGPGIKFLTRLTLLREVHYDVKTQNLVSNPLPELVGLRTGSLASENWTAPAGGPSVHVIKGTGAGAAASADVEITFSNVVAPNTGGDGTTFGACVLSNATGGGGLGITITVTAGAAGAGATGTASIGACTGAGDAVELHEGTSLGASSFDLFDETSVTLRITPDRSVADFFVQGGRWSATTAWLAKEPRAAGDSTVSVWSHAAGVTASVDAYGIGCGWAYPSYTENPTM